MDPAQTSAGGLKLGYFPPEILAIVCRFLSTMQKHLLWQSGDTVLRYKIHTQPVIVSASVICTRTETVPADFASFLGAWPSVKDLMVRTSPPYYDPHHLPPGWSTQNFPKGLERLLWNSYTDSGHWLRVNPPPSHLPHLKSLYLHSDSGITIHDVRMPPSLTELSLRFSKAKFNAQDLKWIPKTIQRLIIRSYSYTPVAAQNVSLAALFPNLHYLELAVAWVGDLASFPASLLKLSLYLNAEPLFNRIIPLLPQSLRSLKFSGFYTFNALTPQLALALPPALEYFKISRMAHLLQDSIEQLPAGLKMLYPFTPVSALARLPLVSSVHCYSLQPLESRLITDLRIDMVSESDMTPDFLFPPALTRLSIDSVSGSVSDKIVRAMPQGLKELITYAHVVVLSANLLPTSLSSLRLTGGDISPLFLESIATLPNLTSLIQEQCLYQGVDTSALASLEHSPLRHLELFIAGTFTSDNIKTLPRHLQRCLFMCKFIAPSRSDFGPESFSLLPPQLIHISFPTFAAQRKPLRQIETHVTELANLESISETHPNLATQDPLWSRFPKPLNPPIRESKLHFGILDFDVRSEAKRSNVACLTVISAARRR